MNQPASETRPPWWRRPPYRTVALLLAVLSPLALAYLVWNPGHSVRDGRFNLGKNGLWLQHSWLADDAWCTENGRTDRCAALRSQATVTREFDQYRGAGIRYLYPHLAPAFGDGSLPGVDDTQVERVLDAAEERDLVVIPWIGGVWQRNVFPEDPQWRRTFIASVVDLLTRHPRFGGVQVNVEPLTSGDEDFLVLLRELRGAMEDRHLLGVAAYPPAPFARDDEHVFWSLDYLRQLSGPADQLSMMLYDTGYPLTKFYTSAVRRWTVDVLRTPLDATVLLGVPAYDDHGVPWHDPRVENVRTSIRGIHAGLHTFDDLPEAYEGVAIYSEWEMDAQEWRTLERNFLSAQP